MRRIHLAIVLALVAVAGESRGIEMFTYFGDGSRIGLPSLEVPIEAYPGIPLRSDRIRARRRAMQTGSAVRVGPGTPVGGVTIRPMPSRAMPTRSMPTASMPEPAAEPIAAPPAKAASPARAANSAKAANPAKAANSAQAPSGKTTSRPVAD